ncbi:MAG: tRNA pseudouridine(38-40) synthase TruA [Balneolaceae bacterium]|nr:MAG: tRNA pseudouridine(38-40) synthase TruA [Balneolaceae bacterium]
MQRYKLTVEYDGTDFHGWQKQPDQRTVEGELEKALSLFYQDTIDVVGQGRTDSGVHAENQTAHADLPGKPNPERVLSAMRGLLPEDMALKKIEKVSREFHARFDAGTRTYEYLLLNHTSPLLRRVAWYPGRNFNPVLLNECADLLAGVHDFRHFCIPSEDAHQTTVCDLSYSAWDEWEAGYRFQICGNRFLRQMVRRLAGTMLRVASGEESLDAFRAAMEGDSSGLKIFTAPPHGLCLKKVDYL